MFWAEIKLKLLYLPTESQFFTLNGGLADFEFKVLKDGTANFSFSKASFADSDVNDVEISLQTAKTVIGGSVTESTTESTTQQTTEKPAGQVDQFLYGDVSADGAIMANDSAIILQKALVSTYSMPIQEKTSNWLKYADVSMDGVITANDSATVLQKVLVGTFM